MLAGSEKMEYEGKILDNNPSPPTSTNHRVHLGSIIDQKGALWLEATASGGLIRGAGRVEGRYAL